MLLIRFLSILPFPILYLFSDFLAFLAFRVVGYRKRLIVKNLKNSFPEKKDAEIQKITKEFYTNLTDVLVETIKSLSMTPEDFKKRVKLKKPELLLDAVNDGKSVIALGSHMCNWEWILLINSIIAKTDTIVGGYQYISNAFTNNLFLKIRSRFGAKMVEKKNILKEILISRDKPKIYGLVADQTPVGELQNRYWTNFLNQETVFYIGGEKIAQKKGMVVIYVDMQRTKRGYYVINYSALDQPPFNDEENFITKNYVKRLEKGIREAPANWLWSHNRWKFQNKPNN